MYDGASLVYRLRRVCGAEHARPAGSDDAVAGAAARFVASPGSAAAAAEVLRVAADADLAVVGRGAGTKLDWGLPPARVDIILDTGRLAGVHRHAPGAAVATVHRRATRPAPVRSRR